MEHPWKCCSVAIVLCKHVIIWVVFYISLGWTLFRCPHLSVSLAYRSSESVACPVENNQSVGFQVKLVQYCEQIHSWNQRKETGGSCRLDTMEHYGTLWTMEIYGTNRLASFKHFYNAFPARTNLERELFQRWPALSRGIFHGPFQPGNFRDALGWSHGSPKVLHVGQRKSQSHAPQRDQSQKLRAMNWG